MNWLSIITAVAASLAGASALMTFFKRSAVQPDPAISAKLAGLERVEIYLNRGILKSVGV